MTDPRQTCFELGRQAYPSIFWDHDGFVSAFSQRCPRHPADLSAGAYRDEYLLLACLAERPSAWEVLDREHIQPLVSVLLRACSSTEDASAALQTFRSLLTAERLATYPPGSGLRAWLRLGALRVALDMRGEPLTVSCADEALAERLERLAFGSGDPAADEGLRKRRRSALRISAQRLLPAERHALRLHVMASWSVTQIGRTLCVQRSEAARLLLHAKTQLRSFLEEALAEPQAPAASASRASGPNVVGPLDLSISPLLKPTQSHEWQGSAERGES